MGAEDIGDHLFIGRPIQHFAILTILDAQHFLAVIVVAPGFAPQICGLQGGHQERDMARAFLFLVHDLLDASV